jgi:hypothetical protein
VKSLWTPKKSLAFKGSMRLVGDLVSSVVVVVVVVVVAGGDDEDSDCNLLGH